MDFLQEYNAASCRAIAIWAENWNSDQKHSPACTKQPQAGIKHFHMNHNARKFWTGWNCRCRLFSSIFVLHQNLLQTFQLSYDAMSFVFDCRLIIQLELSISLNFRNQLVSGPDWSSWAGLGVESKTTDCKCGDWDRWDVYLVANLYSFFYLWQDIRYKKEGFVWKKEKKKVQSITGKVN